MMQLNPVTSGWGAGGDGATQAPQLGSARALVDRTGTANTGVASRTARMIRFKVNFPAERDDAMG